MGNGGKCNDRKLAPEAVKWQTIPCSAFFSFCIVLRATCLHCIGESSVSVLTFYFLTHLDTCSSPSRPPPPPFPGGPPSAPAIIDDETSRTLTQK